MFKCLFENKGISTNAFDWAFIYTHSAGYEFTADPDRHVRSMTIACLLRQLSSTVGPRPDAVLLI